VSKQGFLPQRGNYKLLISYQKAVIIYDCTYVFCERFLDRKDRTIDQMVQAARSGKQNIIEGSKAAVTSTETEIKLTNVAHASLEELLEDYNDFQRVRQFQLWEKDSKEASYVRKLSSGKIPLPKVTTTHENNGSNGSNGSHVSGSGIDENELLRQTFVGFIKSRPPEVCANIMICLINQCNFLLDRQIKYLEGHFTKEGGLRERMYNARSQNRKDKND
jgi:four helix bundle suffix protein